MVLLGGRSKKRLVGGGQGMKEKDLIREIQDLQTEIKWIKDRLEKLEKNIEKK